MALVLGIEGCEPAVNVGVVADDLIEEANSVPGVSTLLGQSSPEDLLPIDQLPPGVRLVPDNAQDVKPRADLVPELLQPAQSAGNRLSRRLLKQDRNQDIIGGRQSVHATGG